MTDPSPPPRAGDTPRAAQESRGLMAFWADIDADYLLRFQQWHNCEHMPERVSIPGFDRGRRYRALDGSPHFLMFYETRTSAVLGSRAYVEALDDPTPWTREALGHFRNPVRNVYELLATAGVRGTFVAPYVASLRFNLHDAGVDAHAGPWLEALAARGEVSRARLYRVDESVSGIMTSERGIYGGGPGAQRFLALVELDAPFDDDPLAAATRAAMPGGSGRRDEFADRYWLEIGHEPARA